MRKTHRADIGNDRFVYRWRDRKIKNTVPAGLMPFFEGPFDQESIQMGSIRDMSALACAMVTPGLRRAIPWNPNPASI